MRWMVLMLVCAVPAALGQDAEPSDPDERLADPAVGLGPIEPAGSEEFEAPAATGLPGIELPSFRPPRAMLVREGAFLTDRRGYVHLLGEDASDGMVFVFDEDAAGRAEPPMLLMPNLRLMELRSIVESRAEALTFEVNGEVFVYRGRNYLLLDFFRIVRPGSGSPQAIEEVDQGDGSRTAEAAETRLFEEEEGDRGPSVEELIGEIERATADRGEVFRPLVGAEAGERLAVREGAVIVRRLGHLRLGDGGAWEFRSENDANDGGDSFSDAPLTALPCLTLERMQQLAERRGGEVTVRLSGVVTVFDGRSYVLPTSFLFGEAGDSGLVSGR